MVKIKKQWNVDDLIFQVIWMYLNFQPMKKIKNFFKEPSKKTLRIFEFSRYRKIIFLGCINDSYIRKAADFVHNQLFYFDPTLGKIEPVVSDSQALGSELYLEAKNVF